MRLDTSFPFSPLTAKTPVNPETHLLLEAFPDDALHKSVFLYLGLPQYGAWYLVPALTPSYCSINSCSSPLWELLRTEPGSYLFQHIRVLSKH